MKTWNEVPRFAIGKRVRVKSGTCTGWIGTVEHSERAGNPVAGHGPVRHYCLVFDGCDCVRHFAEDELEAV